MSADDMNRIRPKLTEQVMLCRACDTYFRGESNFNKHRIGEFGVDRRCGDPADVGLHYYPDKGFWGGPPMTAEQKAKAKNGWAEDADHPESVEASDLGRPNSAQTSPSPSDPLNAPERPTP